MLFGNYRGVLACSGFGGGISRCRNWPWSAEKQENRDDEQGDNIIPIRRVPFQDLDKVSSPHLTSINVRVFPNIGRDSHRRRANDFIIAVIHLNDHPLISHI